MKPKASVVAQKLINLYRQAHVIIGGWTAINPIFINEATPEVLDAMSDLPTGRFLAQHIANLKSGKTPMDSIERELLPYGGMMAESAMSVQLSADELASLVTAISNFTPDQEGLDRIMNLDVIKSHDTDWLDIVRAALATQRPDLSDKWTLVEQTYNAYKRWNLANEILTMPINERTRAEIQADMFEYETYLPMFGDAGMDLLKKLRNFISSIKHTDEQDN